MATSTVREQVDAAVERRINALLARLPPLTPEAEHEAAAILATANPRRTKAA